MGGKRKNDAPSAKKRGAVPQKKFDTKQKELANAVKLFPCLWDLTCVEHQNSLAQTDE